MLHIKALPTQTSAYAGPLLLLILALCCYGLNNLLSHYLIYQRSSIEQWQLWRLLTGHVFHTNFAHLLLNSVAIVLLWGLHGQYYTLKQYVTLFIASALFISGAIYLLDPQMTEYVGLSGVLHAFFLWGALKDIAHKDKTGYLLLVGVIIKIAHEQYFGASVEVAALINANVAVNAHLWGAFAGAGYYFINQYFYLSVANTDNKKGN